jgi:hypothetical protein
LAPLIVRRRTAAALFVAYVVALAIAATRSLAGGYDAGSLIQAFTCIHRSEASWDANTGNGYYGGLQMDMSFQRTYGREFLQAFGTADRWPPAVQLTVAIRAYLSGRGYEPWPNTARLCGLR